MFKKIFILACFSVVSMNVSADALHKYDVAHFQALTGLSNAESQVCITQAHQSITKLYEMGYSDKEIESMISKKVGAAKKVLDPHAGCISKNKMYLLLALTVVASSSIAALTSIALYIGTKKSDNHYY